MRIRHFLWMFVVVCLPAQALPDIEHWKTSNGARVYFVHAPELPIVDFRVVFDAGGARDEDSPGLALLTSGMLLEGAGGLDADSIAERLDDLGVQVSTNSLRDMGLLELRSLSDQEVLKPAMSLLATVLAQPDFPPDAFERVRKQLLVSLRHVRQSPAQLAQRAFYRAVFADHPYARPPDGNEESVNRISTADLALFHARYYVGSNAVIGIVGDLTRGAAEELAETAVKELPVGEPAPPLATVSALKGADVTVQDFPSSQTHILVGQPGMSRRDPDYFPLYVGNHVLGGSGLVSVLSEEVREKRGLAYNAYSYFSPMRVEGPYILGLQTRSDQAEDALEVLHETVAKFVREGPDEAQLEAARKNITGGFALRLDSNKKVLDYLILIGFYGLPLDYLQQFNTRVNAVTVADVRDAFRRRIHPDHLVTIKVGPLSAGATATSRP